jgi:hypothetical protein
MEQINIKIHNVFVDADRISKWLGIPSGQWLVWSADTTTKV